MKAVSLLLILSAISGLFGFDEPIPPAREAEATSQPAGASTRPVETAAPAAVLRFRAVLSSPGGELPFGLHILRGASGKSTARIINGSESIDLPNVEFDDNKLRIEILHYDAVIEATAMESNGRRDAMRRHFTGRWRKRTGADQWSMLPFEAVEDVRYRFRPGPRVEHELSKSPSLEGRWRVKFEKSEGPAIAEFRRMAGGGVEGTILTTTGDYRYLAGDDEGGRLRLSSFDGAHAFLFDAKLRFDESLSGEFWSRDTWHESFTAERDDAATLPDGFGIAELRENVPMDAVAFRDLDGKSRTLDAPAFRGRVRVIEVFGSWCPNCHDAAAMLNEMHDRYGDKGLAVIGVAFEATGQFDADARQVKRFIERHHVKYPVLLAGKRPRESTVEAFPWLERIKAYPTTLFVDREGRVVAAHTGFSGPATGEAHLALRAEFERRVVELLGIDRADADAAGAPRGGETPASSE